MTFSDIPFLRLHNQQITSAKFTDPVKLVASFGAMQSQDYAAAKWAVGLRLKNITDNDIELAFNKGDILRTHVMRPTWHFVAPQDIRWLQMFTGPRVIAQLSNSGRKLGLDEAAYKRSNKLISKALLGGKELTRAEMEVILNKAGIVTGDLHMIHLMMRAELDGLICSGPRKGKQFTYALLDERVPAARTLERDEALAELTTRYFMSHGPATMQDFVWWSGLTTTDARAGIEMVRSKLVQEHIDGNTYWFPPFKQSSIKTAPVVYLLPNYDEYTVAYKDRTAMVDSKYKKLIPRDHVIFNHAIIYEGSVIGTWKRSFKKSAIEMEIIPFVKPGKALKTAISAAIEQYGRFHGLPAIWKQ